MERLVDRLGRGGQAALQHCQREANRPGALVILQRLGAVELLAHIVGHLAVELRLGSGELVGHGVGDALGEERRAIELEQPLLDHAPHQVGDLHLVDAITEASLEAVAVEQGEEELKILLLPIMGRRGHQQQVAGEGAEQLTEPVALGILQLATEEGRRELVRLIADHQVPAAIGSLELLLHRLVAGELVETGDHQLVFKEPVTGAG